MNVLPEALDVLTSRVDALEKRVRQLEHPSGTSAALDMQVQTVPAASTNAEEKAIEQASGVFPVLGTAMLGIAGAYVLRALSERSLVPRPIIAAVAIFYAAAWLLLAARTKTTAKFTQAIYAGTSALILAPMLWELTLRFNLLSPLLAASILSGVVLVATALAWERDVAAVFWMAYGTSALTAIALSIATRELMPFLLSLLFMVLVSELAKFRDRGHSIRLPVAALADVAVGALIFIYSGPQNTRADYPILGTGALTAPGCLLFLINVAGLAFNTGHVGRRITAFETVQCLIAFLLAVSSVLCFNSGKGTLVVGIICLLMSAASYWVAFANFRHAAEQLNFNVYAAWSCGLLLAGVFWTLPPASGAACLGLAAVIAIVLASRAECRLLDFHGMVYLAAATAASGLPGYALSALAGAPTQKPSWSIFLVSAAAVSCYVASKELPAENAWKQLLHFAPALLASWAIVALLIEGMLRLAAFFITPDVSHVAFVRTLAICSVALALAFGGARWCRLQMTRVAYAALAFEGTKLLFEDLRHGRMEFIAGSIFLFAITLIGVPRLARVGRRYSAP
jgi:hypothetical protein